MPVGTGSIKRAAKANVAAGTKVENAPEKPVAKKSAAPKKAAASKKTTPKKAEPKTMVPVAKSVNEVCHLTEELPIHLL